MATAINIKRLVAWFDERPRATTRISRFAVLAPDHASRPDEQPPEGSQALHIPTLYEQSCFDLFYTTEDISVVNCMKKIRTRRVARPLSLPLSPQGTTRSSPLLRASAQNIEN